MTLLFKQGGAQSPFTGAVSVINNYAQWQLQISFPPVRRGSTQEKQMAVWLANLRGIEGSFIYYPADSGKAIGGKSLAIKGYAYSTSIEVGGWTGTQATGLEGGDFFSIGNNLYRITSAPINSSSGTAVITFEPPLRADANGGTTVNFQTPRCEFRAGSAEDAQGFSKDAEFTYLKPIAAVQVL
ncbi:hypothetical protein M2341_000993 [Sphingobium sp. B7D2B]|uniref:hypothetical protein n=1 Tax=Sphingobium sp. B7D2B TaxID=2940583 RepID=UPI0022242E1A|nr:hypothetical protein [Sphingobium sp. B7D2B]MCW2365546.1 hypothetical protein [Sphingobium sp. B7D2B]